MFRAPFDQTRRAKREGDERRDEESFTFLPTFFQKISEKVLTETNANVLLEIFPLLGGGSLKFTLYD